MARMIASAVLLLLLLSGCAGRLPDPLTEHPDLPLPSVHPRIDLAGFLQLSDDDRQARRAAVSDDLDALAFHRSRLYREWQLMMSGYTVIEQGKLKGEWRIGRLMRRLGRVTDTDPTSAEAWYVLGRLRALTGDPVGAADAYAGAWAALPHDVRDAPDWDLPRRIRLEAAWTARDRGLWDEGLEWLDRDGASWSRKTIAEARLVRGLIWAGAGRFREAWAMSREVGPIGFPDDGLWPRGVDRADAWFARTWIETMAWHGAGNAEMAELVLSRARLARFLLPFHDRFHHDMGLIHETAGRHQDAAASYAYSVSGLGTLRRFLPWGAFSVGPMVVERPVAGVPVFTCWDDRLLAGSDFSHACGVYARFLAAGRGAARDREAVRAENAFGRCIRKGAQPDRARALRGRLRYTLGRHAEAEADLRGARTAFAAMDTIDPATDLVLGAILLNAERDAEAEGLLRGVTVAEPSWAAGWRNLGVATARLGRRDEGLALLEKSLAMSPGDPMGWYNVGLFHAESGEWERAYGNLVVAVRLDPGNGAAVEMLQRSASELRGRGRSDALAFSDALADSVLASLPPESGPDPMAMAVQGFAPLAAEPDSLVHAEAEAAYAASGAPADRAQLAEVCLRQGRIERYRELLADADRDREDAVGLIHQLQADRADVDPRRALALVAALAAGEVLPLDVELWALVALTCLEAEERDAGIRALEHALALDPGNEGLRTYRSLIGE